MWLSMKNQLPEIPGSSLVICINFLNKRIVFVCIYAFTFVGACCWKLLVADNQFSLACTTVGSQRSRVQVLPIAMFFSNKRSVFVFSNAFTFGQGSTNRQVRGPTGPNGSEIYNISLFLVRFGPSFEIVLSLGPVQPQDSKIWSVLVRASPGFLQFPRSWSGADRFWPWIPAFGVKIYYFRSW